MLLKIVMLATCMYLYRRYCPPQSLTIWRVDFGLLAWFIARQGADITGVPVYDFPIPPFGKAICHHSNGIKLHKVQDSSGSAVGDEHPLGCSPRGDRATKNHLICA